LDGQAAHNLKSKVNTKNILFPYTSKIIGRSLFYSGRLRCAQKAFENHTSSLKSHNFTIIHIQLEAFKLT